MYYNNIINHYFCKSKELVINKKAGEISSAFYKTYYFFDQVDGEREISSGKISSRPSNIANERTIFEMSE